MKLSQLKVNAARKILIYGAPKTGKTELYGSLPAEGYRLHILDLEQSTKTFLKPTSKAFPYLDKIEVYPIPDTQTTPIGIETAMKVMKRGVYEICHLHGKVDCPLCKMAYTKVCKEAAAAAPAVPSPEPPWSTLNVNAMGEKDILVLETYSQLVESAENWIHHTALSKDDFDAKSGWDEFGKMGRILERVGSNIQAATFNIIVVSHEIAVKMSDGTSKLAPVGGTTNASKVFAKYFDDVVYCETVNGQFRSYCAAEEKFSVVLGSRAGKRLQVTKGDKKEQLGLVELFK